MAESLAYDAAMLGAEADNAVRGIVTTGHKESTTL